MMAPVAVEAEASLSVVVIMGACERSKGTETSEKLNRLTVRGTSAEQQSHSATCGDPHRQATAVETN